MTEIKFTLIDVIILLAVSQGIFLIIALQSVKDQNKRANKILSLLIIITLVFLTGRLLVYRIDGIPFLKLANFFDLLVFVIGPCTYFYIKRLLFNSEDRIKTLWLHLIPAGLHLFFSIGFLMQSRSQLIEFFDQGILIKIFLLIESVAIILLTVYFVLALKTVRDFVRSEQQVLSYHQSVIKFVRTILVFWGLIILSWLSSLVTAHWIKLNSDIFNYNNLWIVITFFIYVLGYFGMRQSEVLKVFYDNRVKPSDKPRLDPTSIEQLCERLTYYIEQEKVFLDSEMSLKTLAKKLHTSTNNLSWLLNNVYHQSFYDFVNAYRVLTVINALERGEHQKITLLAIAFDAGFKSKSTFNKSFKKETGYSPSAFIKSGQVAAYEL